MQNALNPTAAAQFADAIVLEEAARFALLRRLAPTLRHHLVGEFQPIGMIAAMMERRLQAEAPALPGLRENSAALSKLARGAANSCIELMTWLAPRKGATTALDAGVLDCLNLLTTELRFKGWVIVNEVGELPALVLSAALRSTLPVALMALVDQQPGPAQLHLRAQAQGQEVLLTIVRQAAARATENSPVSDYRPMTWRDVEVLAQAESVGFARTAEGVRLSLPVQTPPPTL